jgi:hypothetical protein
MSASSTSIARESSTSSTTTSPTYELIIESNDATAHDLAVPTPPPAVRNEVAVRSNAIPVAMATNSTTTRTLHATRVLGPTTRLTPTRASLIRSDETSETHNTNINNNINNIIINNNNYNASNGHVDTRAITQSSSSSSMTGSGVSVFDDVVDGATQSVNTAQQQSSNSSAMSSNGVNVSVATSDVPFVAGNPSIQLTRGVIHVFKRTVNDPHGGSGVVDTNDDELSDVDSAALPGTRIPLLLLPAVPHTVTHAALVDLLGEAAFDVRHIRIVRGDNDSTGDVYMALLRFNTLAAADRWRAAVHGKPFAGADGPRISALYVARVSLVRRGARLFPHDGAVELPRCVICLERMDSSVTGVMTTQCSHTFHCMCLARWADVQEQQLHDKRARQIDVANGWQIVGSGGKHHSPATLDAVADVPEKRGGAPPRAIASSCPVCRFAQRDAQDAATTRCSVDGCDVAESLWTCLVCATVNCGRAANKHALAHFHESGHAFSLEIATGRIWSYVGDAYVHRLMHAGVESVGAQSPAESGGGGTSLVVKPSKAVAVATESQQMDELFDKDDAMEAEYTYLLTSQLAAQRRHFEQSLHAAERQAQKQVDQLSDENERMRLSMARLEKKLEQAERALANKTAAIVAAEETAARRVAQVMEEKAVLNRLAQQSRDTGRAATASLRETQAQLATAQARAKDLEEELHDMRFALTMSEKVNTNEELQGAQIAGVAAPKVKRPPRRR